MLYRGGLEIGPEGFRLDGVSFFALLSFPATPSQQAANPFDSTPQHPTNNAAQGSPFQMPGDADLCLSLESMRGRKYLQVRRVIELKDDELMESEEGSGVVQMSVAPDAVLLQAYFTALLCRSAELTPAGRTKNAVVIGLGDEGMESNSSSILVFGQRSAGDPAILKLLVGRLKPPPAPPSEKKVRPGEPLPRAPLFFPSKAPRKPPPPFPRRSGSVTFSRATSVSSIYAPPPIATLPPPAPVSGRTPGRRGEKRPKPPDSALEDENRKRKQGRIVPVALPRQTSVQPESQTQGEPPDRQSSLVRVKIEEEDIFGKRPSVPLIKPADETKAQEPPSTGRAKRRVPQQVLDNKAAIRKQTLVLLESRGVMRENEQFKDVFGMTTKGVYFAFRNTLAEGVLGKGEIQDIVGRHLDMYIQPPDAAQPDLGQPQEDVEVKDEIAEHVKSEAISEKEPDVKDDSTEEAVKEEPGSEGTEVKVEQDDAESMA